MANAGAGAICRRANVEKVDAGPKGATITFRNIAFADPPALIKAIAGEGSLAKVRPDQRVVFIRDCESPADRLKGVAGILQRLVGLAEKGKKAA